MNKLGARPFGWLQNTTAARAVKRRLRHWLSRHLRRKILASSTDWPTRPNRPTLIIAPHPDDEALGCGGLIARRVAAGDNVHIAYLTDGSASHPNHSEIPARQLSFMRATEARSAAAVLGVSGLNLSFLEAPDGRLPHLSGDAKSTLIDSLAKLIGQIEPGEIFVTAATDGSTEHAAANALLRKGAAQAKSSARILEYPVWARWNPRLLSASLRHAAHIHWLALTAEESRLKHQAIRCHHSQIKPLAPWDTAVLSSEFLEYFYDSEEFFFEFKSPANPASHAKSVQ